VRVVHRSNFRPSFYTIEKDKAKKVYFVSGGGLVKIGCSENPLERIRALKTGSSDKLRLIGVIPGGRKKERELHARFIDKKDHGEWFLLSKQDLADIGIMQPFLTAEARDEKILELRSHGYSLREIGDIVGTSGTTVMRRLNKLVPGRARSV